MAIHAEVSWTASDVVSLASEAGIKITEKMAEKLLEDNEDDIQLEQIRAGANMIKNILSHLKKK